MSSMLFTIKQKSSVGRYAVATKSLNPGEVIFVEKPFAYGPKSDSRVLCLGCFAPVDCTVFCKKCNWPVCGRSCEELPVHRDNECGTFSQAGVKFQMMEYPEKTCLQYECITPLRVLIEKEKYPERWNQEVQHMESHDQLRKNKPIWKFNEVNIVQYLRGPCRLNQFSEELIHKVCGILEINAFEAHTKSGFLIQCLYPRMGMMSHNCVANTQHSILTKNFTIFSRSSTKIKEGEEIFCNYTYSLWPTLVRRHFLLQSKYFECNCKRCSHKTELGTHLGTLKCQKCHNGVVLSTNPLSFDCEWKCTYCEFKTKASSIKKIYDMIQEEIDIVETISGSEGIELREGLYRKYQPMLHLNNSYLTILKIALSQLYGSAEGFKAYELSDILQERKIELCSQLLDILDVVEPGFTRIRGITLYELYEALIYLAESEYFNKKKTQSQFYKHVVRIQEVIKQSFNILVLEPSESNEGKLALVAKNALDILEQKINLLIQLP